MNILIPHEWLLEHLDTQANPEEIQRLVSLSGPSIERIYDREGESVYDIEVTTNRVDSMSVRGIAREAAVILEQAGVPARLKALETPEVPAPNTEELPVPHINSTEHLSKRIMCVVLSNIQHTPTPDWMAKRLIQIEQNIHDSVIDITNYITHELGHPCHAFDYDKIMALGGVINVVEAQPGKKFITLDGAEYETLGGEIVFENDKGEIIDLPAIKGTMNTAVDDNTKNLLFWLESLPAEKVRSASMTHAIRTVAAQLNEKHVDPVLAADVLKRGVQLYQELCQATVASAVYDEFTHKPVMQPVTVPLQRVTDYLGVTLDTAVITEILTQLGCTVEAKEASIVVTPPSFRPDITIPADVIEEIARIYGYHKLPSVLMDTPIPTSKPTGTRFDLEHACKVFLAHIGWQEVYTYSMVSETVAQESGLPLENHLKLQNPLTDDRVYLRRSLVPSLTELLDNNPQRTDLSVFEIAYVYHPQADGLPEQELHLTLVGQKSYREVRGDVESMLRQFYAPVCTITQTDDQTGSISMVVAGTEIEVGSVQILSDKRVVFDLLLTRLLPALKTHPTYQPLPKAEAVKEDLTFELPEKTAVGKVIERIAQTDTLIYSVELTAIYKQNYTFSIVYLDPARSLSKEEVEPIRKKIIATTAAKFNGSLVGSHS